ncbi:MAG: TetR/AcrR family transcriptional regulator [Clostridia bacterium]|nr:TetR/AcrR family transcriptional regulator [Clostridia bacterium]
MPPKVKITKEDIIKTALELVRNKGTEALNARSVAAELNCSTQPVFSNFATMDELQNATLAAAYDIYFDFIEREVNSGKYPRYKSFGMAYIRFAEEEKQLFKLLFMRDRGGEDISPTPDFTESVEMIMKANSVTREKAELIHLEMWACVHGIGTMLATSFLSLDEDRISNMLSDIYLGICQRKMNDECN